MDYQRDLEVLLTLEVKHERFAGAFLWVERFGNESRMWQYLIDQLEKKEHWEAMAEAVRRLQALFPGHPHDRQFLEERLCRALRGLGRLDEVLALRRAAFRERPDRSLFKEILELSPETSQARAEIIRPTIHHSNCRISTSTILPFPALRAEPGAADTGTVIPQPLPQPGFPGGAARPLCGPSWANNTMHCQCWLVVDGRDRSS